MAVTASRHRQTDAYFLNLEQDLQIIFLVWTTQVYVKPCNHVLIEAEHVGTQSPLVTEFKEKPWEKPGSVREQFSSGTNMVYFQAAIIFLK